MVRKRLLITGGFGFIGSHVVEYLLEFTNWEIVIVDRLDISVTTKRLTDTDIWKEYQHRVKFVWWDLKSPINEFIKRDIGDVDYIWHLAASSHVDRSIEDPLSFVLDNVVGTCNLLNYAREITGLKRLIYFSTDEIFGSAPDNISYKEWDRYNSSNPYAASKAGAEELCLAFANTYDMPIVITHTMNVIGERQHPEKFVPLIIKSILHNEVIKIHANAEKTKAGSRFYIYARNVAEVLLFLNRNACDKEKYNIVGERELDHVELVNLISDIMEMPCKFELVDFHSSRPGHDLRYGLDGTKVKDMGFTYSLNLQDSLVKIVKWYLDNPDWLF